MGGGGQSGWRRGSGTRTYFLQITTRQKYGTINLNLNLSQHLFYTIKFGGMKKDHPSSTTPLELTYKINHKHILSLLYTRPGVTFHIAYTYVYFQIYTTLSNHSLRKKYSSKNELADRPKPKFHSSYFLLQLTECTLRTSARRTDDSLRSKQHIVCLGLIF